MKILFVSSIDQHILRFHLPTLKWLNEIGYEVHVACYGSDPIPHCNVKHNIDFVRLPFAVRNIVSYFQIRRILKKHRFKVVHCHTAVASIITRLACRGFRNKDGLKVFYTAHGFHFFKGSPLYYWLIYYTAERLASRLLDCLITINSEDFELAKAKFFCKDIYQIPGMGADPSKFKKLSKEKRKLYRSSVGIPENAFVIIYAAEFTKIKNQAELIQAVALLKNEISDFVVLLLGRGKFLEKSKMLAKELDVDHIVRFMGFRSDVDILMGISDISVSTSKREGLGLHLVESMMTGLPVVVSNNRGHREIVQDKINGYFFDPGDTVKFCELILTLYKEQEIYEAISKNAIKSVCKFSLESSLNSIKAIYNKYL